MRVFGKFFSNYGPLGTADEARRLQSEAKVPPMTAPPAPATFAALPQSQVPSWNAA